MQLFSNNADASLNGAIASDTTTIVLKVGEGSKFPSPAAGDYFLVTIFDRLGTTELNHEIVKCTSRVGDVLTVTRAQEGTSAKNFPNGACVELRVTAGTLNNKVEKVEGKSLSTEDFTTAEKSKLGGIASGATANSSDAFLKNRANHTGTQAIETIEGLDSVLGTKVSDAPSDGKTYGRKDAAWVEVVSGGGAIAGPRNWYVSQHTTSSTFVVPAGVSVIRPYAFGAGADGTEVNSGGGGGCAYGNVAVTPGATVTLSIAAGVAKVTYGGVDLLIANPASGETGGTASKHASVTNGGAYSGGAGTASLGGASSGSPLGAGVAGNALGGSGWGGSGFGGGGGGAGAAGADGFGGSGLPAPSTDPLLGPLTGAPGGSANNNASVAAYGGAGSIGSGGGIGSGLSGFGGAGGFGGGGGAGAGFGGGAGNEATGGAGGFGGGGGGALSSGATAIGGAGGFGGGGGGGGGAGGGVDGAGGAAVIRIYY